MDTESLLRSLNAHGVDYVIIGATAFPVHGYSRATLDIDIFIRPTAENARQTRTALQDFGYDMTEATAGEMLAKKILIRQYAVETDIHPFVKGVMPNWIEWVVVHIAASRIGAISNPLIPIYRHREMEFMVGLANGDARGVLNALELAALTIASIESY